MKKVYISPEIEYDEFRLVYGVCADLYDNGAPGAEFYAVGGGNGVSEVPEVTNTVPGRPPRT